MPFEKNSKNKFSNLKFLLRKKKKSLCPWSKPINLMKSKSSQTRPNPPKFIFWSEKIKIKLFNLVSFAAFIKLAMLFLPKKKKKKSLLCWKTKFNYKIGCNFRLQPYSISFYWRWILTNLSLDYILFLYPPCSQKF